MKYLLPFLVISLLGCMSSESPEQETSPNPEPRASSPTWSIVIHGGVGNFDAKDLSEAEEAAYSENLQEAIDRGSAVLKNGGTAMDAVEAAIILMEDCPLFNAGKGAVFTAEGINEMDASFMDGETLNCGAVTGIQNIKNPIKAARLVMSKSDHVFFSGIGATQFAKDQGLEIVDSSYFYTEKRWNSFLRAKERDDQKAFLPQEFKYGTVGCTALDKNGNLAAGTSTGGMTYKKNGRIGDSPVIAAGTYADNKSAAISCTGHGEYFIRAVVAHDICARMEHGGKSLQEAADEVIMDKLVDMGGSGGIIGVDKDGNVSMTFNSTGMFRAWRTSSDAGEVLMYK